MTLKAKVTATCDTCAYVADLVVNEESLSHPGCFPGGTVEMSVLVEFKQDTSQYAYARPMEWAHHWDDDKDDFVDTCPYCLARIADLPCLQESNEKQAEYAASHGRQD